MGMREIGQQQSKQQHTEKNKPVLLKNWAPFIDSINEINNEINNPQLENKKVLMKRWKCTTYSITMITIQEYNDVCGNTLK